jgi:hypothetical protein
LIAAQRLLVVESSCTSAAEKGPKSNLAELYQIGQNGTAEINQRLAAYQQREAMIDRKREIIRANEWYYRNGYTNNPYLNGLLIDVKQELDALGSDLRSIARLHEAKRQEFEQKRNEILRKFPNAVLPSWAN